MRKSWWIAAGLLSATSAQHADAATVVVAPSAANAAIAAAKPGDEIVLLDGTYQNISLTISVSGTSSLPITIRSQSPLGVKISGNSSRLTVRGSWLIVRGFSWSDVNSDETVMNFRGATNCVFRDNDIVSSGRVPEGNVGLIRLRDGSQNNVFERNRFQAMKSQGIQVWSWDGDAKNTGNIFRWNHFVENSGLEVLQLGQGAQSSSNNDGVQGTIVEHNLFENITHASELISCKTSGNHIRYNTFRNCADQVVLRNGTDNTVEGNYFFQSRGIRCHDRGHLIVNNYLEAAFSAEDKAISLYCGNHERPDITGGTHYPAHQVRVINNTIVNHGTEQLTIGMNYNYSGNGYTWNIAPSKVEVRNNLIVNDHGTSIRHIAGTGTIWQSNVVFPSGSGQQGFSGSGPTVQNPLMVNDGAVFRLGSTSPVIGKGASNSSVTIDIEGQARKASPDVGCDEYSGAAIANKPLVASEVGPGSGGTGPSPSDAGVDSAVDSGQSGADSAVDSGQLVVDGAVDSGQPVVDSAVDSGQPVVDSAADSAQLEEDSSSDVGLSDAVADGTKDGAAEPDSGKIDATVADSGQRDAAQQDSAATEVGADDGSDRGCGCRIGEGGGKGRWLWVALVGLVMRRARRKSASRGNIG